MRRRLALIVALSIAPVLAAAVVPQAPRDVTLREGTASIAGVVSSDDGAPLAHAVVTLNGGTVAGFTKMADERGRFEFTNLPAAQFTLSAAKPGFSSMSYGQTAPGRGLGLPMALKDGERRTGVNWSLPRTAAISGRLLDESGRPARNFNVIPQRRRLVDGELRLVNCCDTARTDPNGYYRLANLPPGEYSVSAIPPGDYMAIPDGRLSSFGEETRRISDEEVRWAQREIEAAAGRSGAAPAPAAPPRGQTMSYGRSYFPGTLDPARVAMVLVNAGDERRGVDFAMLMQATASIRGRVVAADGQPAATTTMSFSDGWSTSTGALAADGTFVRRNLLPGRYTISIRGRGASTGFASQVLEINGADVNDLVMTLGPAASISGRVVFEGEAKPTDATSQPSISLRPTNGITAARAGTDGAFTIANVEPGRYRLNASLPPANRGAWSLKSITLDGRDVSELPFDIVSGQSVADVVVTFTNQISSLAGALLTADDAPAGGYYVVVFPSDPALWWPGSRRMPAPARASTDGRFTFSALPAGAYCLAALTAVDETDLADPAFLTTLKKAAITVTLADGESKVQDVKFARR